MIHEHNITLSKQEVNGKRGGGFSLLQNFSPSPGKLTPEMFMNKVGEKILRWPEQ
jgi:hypothetical protein